MLIVEDVVKMYAPNIGLRSANFSAEAGDVFALIGPNGSGKSTLLKILCDIYRPDQGSCMLSGKRLDQCKDQIGFLPEIPYLVDALTGIQFLRYIAGMKNLQSSDGIHRYIKLFQADTYGNVKLRDLSQGQRKRFALIAALVGDPALLILDEPTNGFDTMTLLQLKRILAERSNKKKITILSSHVLDFVQNVATEVMFIKNGVTLKQKVASNELENEYFELFIGEV